MPDIPAEQNRSFGRIWDTFLERDSVDDGRHDSNEWSGRSGDFIMCCVRVPAEALEEPFHDLRTQLEAIEGIRLHPPAFLHVAVQELGFVTAKPTRRDEFTQARLDEFLSYIDRPISDFSRFTITLGGANSFADAAFLEVRDNGWLSRIHLRMRDFVIIPPYKHFPYLPFTTFAHYTGTAPAPAIAEVLAPYRDVTFATFEVNEIDVVRLSVDEPYPQLRIEQTIRLGIHHLEAPVRPLPIDSLDDPV